MGNIISARIHTLKDEAGNPLVLGWLTLEFRGTGYMPGGEVFDLSTRFRRIEEVLANPASGALDYLPLANLADFPGDPRSGRLLLHYIGSGAVTVNTSGQNITVLSGQLQPLSGYTAVWSGQQTLQATAWRPEAAFSEVRSGIAISGTRAKVFVLGY